MSQGHLSKFEISTVLTMLGRNPSEQYGFVNAPLYKGSTVVYKTLDDIEQKKGRFSYGTAGSPTIANLESAWTLLSGAAGTVLSPSGLGAVALALMSTTKAGDHILVPDSVYRSTRRMCDTLLRKYCVEVQYYDPCIGSSIKMLLRPNTSTILLESPGSRTMEVQDLPAIVEVARARSVKTILDNTWATPIFFDAFAFGVDISVEAGTKYLGGHSDMLLGLAAANADTWPALRATYDAIAMLPGAEDCILALRGMRTMHLRLREVEKKALAIAHWLKSRPEVDLVFHPALEDCPGNRYWRRDFKGSSGLFSIALKGGYGRASIAAMLEGFSIFGMGFSWGGYESLMIPFHWKDSRDVVPCPFSGPAFRLQIGLEDTEDLITDLKEGFQRLAKRPP
jgi:cystathionine beta-lyase